MSKTIQNSKFVEQAGLDRISQEVRNMGHLWREITKDDYGIDGEIELLKAKPSGDGREVSGKIIKVQAKAGNSYITRDKSKSFSVKSRKEDFHFSMP